ncbi:MAG: hypothetical protein AAGJ08_29525 [Cyanobacteria bacterium P01_H01_bin.35]
MNKISFLGYAYSPKLYFVVSVEKQNIISTEKIELCIRFIKKLQELYYFNLVVKIILIEPIPIQP